MTHANMKLFVILNIITHIIVSVLFKNNLFRNNNPPTGHVRYFGNGSRKQIDRNSELHDVLTFNEQASFRPSIVPSRVL